MRNAERVEDKILNAIRKGVMQLEVNPTPNRIELEIQLHRGTHDGQEGALGGEGEGSIIKQVT